MSFSFLGEKNMHENTIKGIHKYGRKLEIARLNYLLKSDCDGVIEALLDYQNQDGGFGKGLEPDQLSPLSSPIQSWYAMVIIKQMNSDKLDVILPSLLDYLKRSFNQKTQKWDLYQQSNMMYPHAPWWTYQENDDSYNPTAAILGFILRFSKKDHLLYQNIHHWLESATNQMKDPIEPMDMHELRCFVELVDDLFISDYPFSRKEELKELVIKRLDVIIERNPEKWFITYCAKPSFFVLQKDSFVIQHYHDLLMKEMDLTCKKRDLEGLWEPTFSWGNQEVDNTWKAIIAVDMLYLNRICLNR